MTHPASPHLILGRKGEDLAARYLEQRRGLVVLSRNWRCKDGELDLVLTDGRTLVVCEVKTRTSTHFGAPGEAVTDQKAARIRRLTRRWQRAYHVGLCDVRYDIVSVLWPPGEPPTINHLPAVF